MRKVIFTIISVIVLSSCCSYLDKGENTHSEYMDFNYMENYNEFIYKSKVNVSADKEIYYTTHFSINLPKRIKNWQTSNNNFYFEYDNKQIIYINSGYKNRGTVGNWTIQETNNDEIYNKLSSYWNERKYNENSLKVRQSGRVSKIYSDGKATILLYNIKEENIEKYLDLVKSFSYR